MRPVDVQVCCCYLDHHFEYSSIMTPFAMQFANLLNF